MIVVNADLLPATLTYEREGAPGLYDTLRFTVPTGDPKVCRAAEDLAGSAHLVHGPDYDRTLHAQVRRASDFAEMGGVGLQVAREVWQDEIIPGHRRRCRALYHPNGRGVVRILLPGEVAS